MSQDGILVRATGGNQGARDGGYAMKTYYVTYYSKAHKQESEAIVASGEDGKVEEKTKESSITCPDCDGSGTLRMLFPKYAEGVTGPPALDIACTTCNGSKVVSSDYFRFEKSGLECLSLRQSMDLGLREAADKLGIKASELLSYERGRSDPTLILARLKELQREGGF
jgi:DNA-directed RNA polymerase subunit M/transcription elongation factor TFIIS